MRAKRIGDGATAPLTTGWNHLQSSICNPGTRANSFVLLVTKVAPKLSALVEAGAPVLGIGQDPPAKLQAYATEHGQHIPTVSEAPPYELSASFGISVVPTVFPPAFSQALRSTVHTGEWTVDSVEENVLSIL